MDLNEDGAGEGAGAGTIDDLTGGSGGEGAGGEGAGGEGAGGEGAGGEGAGADFLGQFSAEAGEGESASNRDYIQSKGFKDLDGLVKAYRGAEKALHDTGRIKVPGEGATEQEIAEYRTATGVPEKPEDYARPEFKDADGKAIAYNSELTDRIFAAAHKIGLPKEAAERLVKGEIEQQIADFDAGLRGVQDAANEHVKGWGENREAMMAQVNAALKDLGFSRDDVQHMRMMPSGVGKFLDAMAKVGSNFSEDTLIKGDRKQFGQKPAEAQKEIDAMRADPATLDKMTVPGTPENKRYNRLLAAAGAATVDN